MKRLAVALALTSTFVGWDPLTRAGATTCNMTVPSGGNIASAVANMAAGQTVCLAQHGIYAVTSTINLKNQQTLLAWPSNGSNVTAAKILCPKVTFCIRVNAGAHLSGGYWAEASDSDIEVTGGTVDGCLEAASAGFNGTTDTGSGVAGVKINGTNSTVGMAADPCGGYSVEVLNNDQFGIVANSVGNVAVHDCFAQGNPTVNGLSVHGGDGFTSEIKFNSVSSGTIDNCRVLADTGDPSRSKALWLDSDTHNVTISGGTLISEGGDALRIEASCNVTVSGGSYAATSGGQAVDIFNSHNASVTGAKINTYQDAAVGQRYGYRILNSGRTGTSSDYCATAVGNPIKYEFLTNNNSVRSNSVTFYTSSSPGAVGFVQGRGFMMSGNVVNFNTYHTCATGNAFIPWHLASGFTSWSGWTKGSFDTGGTCTT